MITLPPIADILARTGLSQVEFAWLLGVSVRTLQEWEQRCQSKGLTEIPNGEEDWFEDDFGEHQLVFPEGTEGDVYESGIVKFKVRHFGEW